MKTENIPRRNNEKKRQRTRTARKTQEQATTECYNSENTQHQYTYTTVVAHNGHLFPSHSFSSNVKSHSGQWNSSVMAPCMLLMLVVAAPSSATVDSNAGIPSPTVLTRIPVAGSLLTLFSTILVLFNSVLPVRCFFFPVTPFFPP